MRGDNNRFEVIIGSAAAAVGKEPSRVVEQGETVYDSTPETGGDIYTNAWATIRNDDKMRGIVALILGFQGTKPEEYVAAKKDILLADVHRVIDRCGDLVAFNAKVAEVNVLGRIDDAKKKQQYTAKIMELSKLLYG